MTGHICSAVLPYLLESLAQVEHADQKTRESVQQTLAISRKLRAERAAGAAAAANSTSTVISAAPAPAHPTFSQEVDDMDNDSQSHKLPGKELLRKTGVNNQPSKDPVADEVYDNVLKVLEFFWDVFGHASVDGRNMKIVSSVHYNFWWPNAQWYSSEEGTVKQLLFGNGDGARWGHFTRAIDMIGHEIMHGITAFASHLVYEGEAGALNEHLSDVFGILAKQKIEGTTADRADWLIGEVCFIQGVNGVAMRNMLHPGTAYRDLEGLAPPANSDFQPDHYSKVPAVRQKYRREVDMDNGGVYVFSGIPNRAFALAASRFGGFTWEKAGRIWWAAATSTTYRGRILNDCTFVQFAGVVIAAAKDLFGENAANIVRYAWTEVGVQVKAH